MKTIKGLLYTKEHEWIKTEGNRVFIGITDFAQEALGGIVFVELPKVGTQLSAGVVLGTVESVKTVSDVYSPVAGKVIEVNSILEDEPEKLNEAPFENWLAVLEVKSEVPIEGLMDAAGYEAFCKEEE
jgi:glycine cleavage system H protein